MPTRQFFRHNIEKVSIVAETTPVVLFAASELQKYLLKISGCLVPIYEELDEKKPSIIIGGLEWCSVNTKSGLVGAKDLKNDGYFIKSIEKNLILTSKMDRGVIYAVYALLEHMGCRWFSTGEKGEVIPQMETICINDMLEVSNPDFEIRSYLDASTKKPTELWCAEMIEEIDWCCKNKINSIMVHHDVYKELQGIDIVRGEIKKRGLIYEFGGHGTQLFINRDLFEHKPHLFREKDGLRRKDGNFCGSSDEAMSIILKGVEELLEKNSGIDILHLWFDDVYGDSWCNCEKCKSMLPTDQIMNVINKIYIHLSSNYPELKGDMILYHDSLETNKMSINPHPSIIGYYAPRERCYAHGIGDSSCERNMEYHNKLKDAIIKFGDNVYALEYYTDMILYSKMKILIPKVIIKDLAEYKKIGVNMITSLGFLRYSRWAYTINYFVYAKAAWDLNYDYINGLYDFCEKLYPESCRTMIEYYSLLEQASIGILAFCKYSGLVYDIRNIPPQSAEFNLKHIEDIKVSIELLEKCGLLLKKLLGSSRGRERILLEDEIHILNITLMEANAIYFQMLGRYMDYVDQNMDLNLFKTYMDKAIECKVELKKLIENVSEELKGSCGTDPYVKHLCDDQIDFLENLKANPKYTW